MICTAPYVRELNEGVYVKTVKAILFDLGNVLVRFDPKIAEKAYGAYGKIWEGSFVNYLMDSDICNSYMEGKLTSSQFYSRTCRYLKIKIKYGEFYDIWNSIFFSDPDMEKLVSDTKKKYPEIKLALLSNTNEEHYKFLEKEYKILEFLDFYVVSHEVGKIKPHPDMFKEALRLTGTFPKETFYTDDREDLIESARTMGIRAYQFTGHQRLREQLDKSGIQV